MTYEEIVEMANKVHKRTLEEGLWMTPIVLDTPEKLYEVFGKPQTDEDFIDFCNAVSQPHELFVVRVDDLCLKLPYSFSWIKEGF